MDVETAQAFARHEVKRGLGLSQVLVYWAACVGIEVDTLGRIQLWPSSPPAPAEGSPTVNHPSLRSTELTTQAEAPEDQADEETTPIRAPAAEARGTAQDGASLVDRRGEEPPGEELGHEERREAAEEQPIPDGEATDEQPHDESEETTPIRPVSEEGPAAETPTAAAASAPEAAASEETFDVQAEAPVATERRIETGAPEAVQVEMPVEEMTAEEAPGPVREEISEPEVVPPSDRVTNLAEQTDTLALIEAHPASEPAAEATEDRKKARAERRKRVLSHKAMDVTVETNGNGQNSDDALGIHIDIKMEVAKVLKVKRWQGKEGPFKGFGSPPGKF